MKYFYFQRWSIVCSNQSFSNIAKYNFIRIYITIYIVSPTLYFSLVYLHKCAYVKEFAQVLLFIWFRIFSQQKVDLTHFQLESQEFSQGEYWREIWININRTPFSKCITIAWPAQLFAENYESKSTISIVNLRYHNVVCC